MNLPLLRPTFKDVLAIAGLCLLFAYSAVAQSNERPIQMLVVGDSLVWGQGLLEKDKTYTHVAEWLAATGWTVELKVKAHSGATLKLHAEEEAALKKGNLPENTSFHGEISFGFPSSWKQLEVASEEYSKTGIPAQEVGLIIISGCITDIEVANILAPTSNIKELPPLVKRFCGDDMFDTLVHANRLFPNAKIAVLSYFPMIGPKSPPAKVFNGWLEAIGTKRPLKPIINNILTRPFLLPIKSRAIKRSRVWFTESNRNLNDAISRFNSKTGATTAVFVPTPVTEETAIETSDSLLIRMGKKGRVDDPLYDFRVKECKAPYEMLARLGGLVETERFCQVSGLGHPNPKGAKAYGEAAIKALSPVLVK